MDNIILISLHLHQVSILMFHYTFSYYGGRIWESLQDRLDADVMFHLRNEHYDHCTKKGIDGELKEIHLK